MQNQTISEWYTNYAADLYRFAVYKLHDEQAAQDVVSEVFVRVMQKEDLADISNVKLWLLGFVRNIILSKYRKEKKWQPLDSDLVENYPEQESQDFNQEMLTQELIIDVKKEMLKLSELEQEVLTLKIWQELTFTDIATLLEININNIKAIYYRGLEKMRKNFDTKPNKLNVIALPLLVAAIAKLKSDIIVPASIINFSYLTNMTNSASLPLPSVSGGLSAAGKIKVISILVGASLVVGGGVGSIAYINSRDSKVSSTTTPVPTVESTTLPEVSPSILPTTDPYAEWNTYKNEAFGIRLNHPDSFDIQEVRATRFIVKSTLQGPNAKYLLDFFHDEEFFTDPLMKLPEKDFTLEIEGREIEFIAYVFGDGSPIGNGQVAEDNTYYYVGDYSDSIQIVVSHTTSKVTDSNGNTVSSSAPTEEELEIGNLILQSIREL